MDKTHPHPVHHQVQLPVDDGLVQGQCRIVAAQPRRVMPFQGVVNQGIHERRVLLGGCVLEGAHAQVGGGNPGEDGTVQGSLPVYRFAAGDHGQAAGGGDAQRMHGFADQVLPEHGAHGGTAVTAPGKGGASGALELDIHPGAIGQDLFAEQDGAAIAQHGQIAELVTGVGLGNGVTARDQGIAAEYLRLTGQGVTVQSKLVRQGGVEAQQGRTGRRVGLAARKQGIRQPGVAVIKLEAVSRAHDDSITELSASA